MDWSLLQNNPHNVHIDKIQLPYKSFSLFIVHMCILLCMFMSFVLKLWDFWSRGLIQYVIALFLLKSHAEPWFPVGCKISCLLDSSDGGMREELQNDWMENASQVLPPFPFSQRSVHLRSCNWQESETWLVCSAALCPLMQDIRRSGAAGHMHAPWVPLARKLQLECMRLMRTCSGMCRWPMHPEEL